MHLCQNDQDIQLYLKKELCCTFFFSRLHYHVSHLIPQRCMHFQYIRSCLSIFECNNNIFISVCSYCFFFFFVKVNVSYYIYMPSGNFLIYVFYYTCVSIHNTKHCSSTQFVYQLSLVIKIKRIILLLLQSKQ